MQKLDGGGGEDEYAIAIAPSPCNAVHCNNNLDSRPPAILGGRIGSPPSCCKAHHSAQRHLHATNYAVDTATQHQPRPSPQQAPNHVAHHLAPRCGQNTRHARIPAKAQSPQAVSSLQKSRCFWARMTRLAGTTQVGLGTQGLGPLHGGASLPITPRPLLTPCAVTPPCRPHTCQGQPVACPNPCPSRGRQRAAPG